MASLVTYPVQARPWLFDRAPVRTPGRHISDIIADLVRTVPSLAKVLETDQDTVEAMWSVGLGWEDAAEVIAKAEGKLLVRMPQITVEGIILSLDYLSPLDESVDECKLTWKSLNNWDIRDSWRWMTQVKGYCYGYGIRKARFWVFHLNGDYHPPSPVLMRYELEFSDLEISECWRMLTTHAAYMTAREETETALNHA